MRDLLDFATELRSAGFVLDGSVVADGEWHRPRIEGDRPGTLNGAYIISQREGTLRGTYGDWKTQEWISWNPSVDTHRVSKVMDTWLPASRRSTQRTVDFGAIWNQAAPADPSHPYLIRKGVRPFGIRQTRGQLLIPVRRIDGVLTGIQRIAADGEKRFYKGTKKAGAFHVIGEWENTVLIAEGYATAATCHMLTGCCTVVAFDASNLSPVGRSLREAFPFARLIFMADDDEVGRREASRAKEISRGAVLNPNQLPKEIK
jgi:putative DNA primase/helicase